MPPTAPSVRSLFRTEAVVDWLEVSIETAAPTQFRWVQERLRAVLGQRPEEPPLSVKPLNQGPGGSSTSFVVRFHDERANSGRLLLAALSDLDRLMPLAQPACVHRIEVALDFYSRGLSDEDHRSMTLHLQEGLAARGSNPRQYDPYRKTYVTLNPRYFPQQVLDPNYDFRIGNEEDPESWHVYWKRTDKGKPLEQSETRARAEVTLSGERLAQLAAAKSRSRVELEELCRFDFAALAGLLHFCRLKPLAEIVRGKDPAVQYALSRVSQRERSCVALYPFGWCSYARDSRTGKPRFRGHGKPLRYNRHMDADNELNRIVRDRLNRLTARFSA